jgi:hypothetical protein
MKITWKEKALFWNRFKVNKTCWEWTGAKSNGYGMVGMNNKVFGAHRVSYEMVFGKIETGMVIDHVCRNRKCINPEHLRCVSNRENVLENSESAAAKNLKKTHCIRGHLLAGTNLRKMKKSGRECKICHDNYMKTYMKNYTRVPRLKK